MTIKTVVIEDEPKSLAVLNELIRQFAPDLQVRSTAGHVDLAVKEIETHAPDLVFMDVRIADGTSFDILKKLNSRRFELIFVTAYDHYALDAIRFSAIDYLLKPISIDEFQEAVDRARKKLSEKQRYSTIDTLLHNLANRSEQDKKISIPTVNGYEFVSLSEIIWCKSDGHYTTFFLQNGVKVTSSRHPGFYEELLNNYNFCRINHGIMINMHFIKSYMKGKGGCVVMTDGTELEISQRRKSDFLNRLAL